MLSNTKHIVTKIFIVVIIQLFYTHIAIAQQFNNWYFPNGNGINFKVTSPQVLLTNPMKFQNFTCASISDKNGNLLFASNGIGVWDKKNNLMPNGFGLRGEYCQINGAMIIPFSNDTNKYYLFTSYGLTFGPLKTDTIFYRYNIIDMQANGGHGNVIEKNKIIRPEAAEKMVAIPHANGTDIWWICRDWSNHFFSYKITCNGFDTSNYVISKIGENINNDQNKLIGDIKASSDGRFIASVYRNYVELYRFNNATGVLSDAIKIPTPVASYGVEFSPNSKLLYISQAETFLIPIPELHIVQYNLASYDSTSIMNSFLKITELEQPLGLGNTPGLQLGPDGKIYSSTNFRIDRIENPDILGMGCNFKDSILFTPNLNQRRFPYAPPFLFVSPNVQIPNYKVSSDCRTVALTGKTYIKGNNLSFKWKFGDGDSTIQNVPSGGDTSFATITHFYPPGIDTFIVQLFVTSDTVCGEGSANKKVIVKPPKPTAKFGVAISCNRLLVNFIDSSLLNFNPSITYQWQFFSKTNMLLGSSIVQNPGFSFAAYDTFLVRLIVSSALACVEADTLLKTIVLSAKPIADFSYSNDCGSFNAAFKNNSFVAADTLKTYYWSLGNGAFSTSKTLNYTYPAFGNYTVKLVVGSSLGCSSDTVFLPVTIRDKPIANFIYKNNACVGLNFLLQDSAFVNNTTINNHYWLLPNGDYFTTKHINPSFNLAGTYPIKYVVTTAQGCTSDTIAKPVFVEPIPLAAMAPTIGGCVNTPTKLSSLNSTNLGAIKNYIWKINNTDSIVSTINSVDFTYPNFGNYTVEHYVVSNNGCISNTARSAIAIHSIPQTSFTNSLACLGKLVNFSNTSNNIFGAINTTDWSINNTPINTNNQVFSYTFNRNGNYTVGLKTTTSNGCSNSFKSTIVVEPALANAGKDTVVLESQPFILQGSGGIEYLWQPPTGLNNINIANPSGLLNNSQQYTVRVTTAQGCVGIDTVLVTVLRNLKIPNAFSPNGDGINETWNIEQLKDYPNAVVQIFNRNGQVIYSNKGSNIIAWNGNLNNKTVPFGTYYYIITLNNSLRNKPFSGWIMVIK
ncbi:MAG: hypothetical protein EAZ35_07215 [Sphingobacteriia bacterium]|nr:MAG: hypothetical protein EAZ35_07215 [Sphingobacteriia bacterium]